MAQPADNVARFEALRFTYPQAKFSFDAGWYFGALRDDDLMVRSADLGHLIDMLIEREESREGPVPR